MTVLNQIYQNQLQKEVTINENFSATSIAGIFADRGNHNGLNFNYYGGRYQKQDGTQGTIANGSIALTDNTDNYVYFNLQDELIQNTTTTIPLNCFPIAKLTTSSGVIAVIEDLRVVALYANGTPTNLSYTLPIASATVLGGIKIGSGLSIDIDGVLTTNSSSSFAELINDTTTARTIALTDAGKYLRFTNTSAKTVTFSSTVTFIAGQEFHITNRATAGNLTLAVSGITLNAPKLGSLILEPKDTVTVKFISSTEADVFGSTKVA